MTLRNQTLKIIKIPQFIAVPTARRNPLNFQHLIKCGPKTDIFFRLSTSSPKGKGLKHFTTPVLPFYARAYANALSIRPNETETLGELNSNVSFSSLFLFLV
jgi:hypothetical protein